VTALLDRATLILFVVAIFGASAFDGCEARAQSRPRPADVRDVAICLVAEYEHDGADWLAILDVLERRAAAHHMSTAAMARAYCAVHRSPRPSVRQLRLRALPGGRPSLRLARLYQAALVAARAGGPGTCDASHWGSAEDVRLRWPRAVVADCGVTRNVFIGGAR
jgi:hypothetical protein